MSVLWVDYRKGSVEFITPLRRLGIDAKEANLDSADFTFEGNGPDGKLEIAVERKALSDLVTSLRDGRLVGLPTAEGKGGQLHRLLAAYDVCWLLIEGTWAVGKDGKLTTVGRYGRKLPGNFSEDGLTKQLLSIELKGQLRMHHTVSERESTAWLASLVRWWTDKTWDQHHTLHVTHRRQHGLVPLSTFREMLLPLPGLGLAGTKAVEKHFKGSMLSLLSAPYEVLAGIQVETPAGLRKLGVRARELQQALDKLR